MKKFILGIALLAGVHGQISAGLTFKGKYASYNFSGAENKKMQLSLVGATFNNCSLEGANFSGADLMGATFNICSLEGANFSGADLTGATFNKGNLNKWTTFEGATLTDAKFNNVFFRSGPINFTNANLTGVSFPGTDMRSAQDFSGANLTNADLSSKRHLAVNFTGANLSNANLSNTWITGANFTDAKLKGANLDGVTYGHGTNFEGACLPNPPAGNPGATWWNLYGWSGKPKTDC